MSKLLLVVLLVVYVRGCYWNSEAPYQLFGSKTSYDTVRGDIRDYASLSRCEAVSVWTLNRHGNRHPGAESTDEMKLIAALKDEIIKSFNEGNSQLCAQDIEDLTRWNWNKTLEEYPAYLTPTGYHELYGIGRRIREKYPSLLNETESKYYYFRPTRKQRTIASCAAFVHGFTEGTKLNATVEEARKYDDVIRPYDNCYRYTQHVKGEKRLNEILKPYFGSPEYEAIRYGVQVRLGINTKLNDSMIFAIYEMCRFYRSWAPDRRSPWCAAFTDDDLFYLEYHDDIKHYYRNGYGTWINAKLGEIPLKDLYENFMAFTKGGGRRVTAYFTHDTMMEMAYAALGLNKDPEDLKAAPSAMNVSRLWRSSHIGSFATNMIAVLNRCAEYGFPTTNYYRVQIFINEKLTPICPLKGCTWKEFQKKFEGFSEANLEFCGKKYDPSQVPSTDQKLWPWL